MVLVTHLEEDVAMAGWFDSSGKVGNYDQVDWASLLEAGDITNGFACATGLGELLYAKCPYHRSSI